MRRTPRFAAITAAVLLGLVLGADTVQPPRAWLGFGYTVHRFTPDSPVRQWLYVRTVESSSPALAAGLRVQDAIVAINGKPVSFAGDTDALAFFRRVKVGNVLKLKVLRAGKPLLLSLRAAPRPSTDDTRWQKNHARARDADAARRKP